MTHSVVATSNAAAALPKTTASRAARTTGASFAEFQAAAVKDTKAKSTTGSASGSSSSDAPTGERTQTVSGHNYAEIISGPRNGMFVNTSGNKRSGQAFVLVQRNGREFHIYGSGHDRAVYEVGRKRADGSGSGTTGTSGTGATTGTSGTGASTTAATTGAA